MTIRFGWAGLAAGMCCLALSTVARADMGFPDDVKLPPQIVAAPDQSLQKEDVWEGDSFETAPDGSKDALKGRHFERWTAYKPAAGEPALGYDNGTEGRIYTALQPRLKQAGWQPVYVNEKRDVSTYKLDKGGKTLWLRVQADAPQAQVKFEVVETGSFGSALSFKPPAPTPEKIADKDELPWLPPYPGATRTNVGHGAGPMDVAAPGAGGEPMLVGRDIVTRTYQAPGSLSVLQFIGETRTALVNAGWQMVYPATDAEVKGFGSLAAHYAKDKRDIWIRLEFQSGNGIWYQVADVSAADVTPELKKVCHVPLYGVFFDFNKASLKPDSDAALQKVAASANALGAVPVEIQGHTDNVGGDDYNMKLSDARAASVKSWLVAHGVAAARITSKGYGKTMPIADNGTDEGRARNRRVEMALPGCKG